MNEGKQGPPSAILSGHAVGEAGVSGVPKIMNMDLDWIVHSLGRE
jgi:hypothetical protein